MPIGKTQGLLAIVSGAEVGFLALTPVGDQIAYITGTTTDSAQAFVANADIQGQLSAVMDSLRVPAEQPTPVSPPLGGLGGLQPAATEPATGGLGGLTVPPAASATP